MNTSNNQKGGEILWQRMVNPVTTGVMVLCVIGLSSRIRLTGYNDMKTGRFMDVKTSGGKFKGVRKEK